VRLAYCFEPEERLAEGARRFVKALDQLWPETGRRGRAQPADRDNALV
jgi:hypothetical protein